ncbi:hypothetical protein NP493_274g02011 [Ridgeia piscesae]|uniref:LRRCT domain-containing protein n=1 Tax=Ridgeia piscesae TaxID=27915 RepID=A0AAD9NXG7_RIDPI|nr:hypothetical protein NP493_274g02011 [Ridgeia piscesae]
MVRTFGISIFIIILLINIRQSGSAASAPPLTFRSQTGKCTLPGLEKCFCSWISGNDGRLDAVNCTGVGFEDMSVLHVINDTVKTIVFTGNDLTTLNVSVLKSATNLKNLDLSSNNINSIMPGGFSALQHLEELNLSNNSWMVKEDTELVFENVTLKKLYLNNAFESRINATMVHATPLSYVFGSKTVMGNLEDLHLASNDMYFVDSEILCNMPKLRYLDLSHNHIYKLPCNATCLGGLQHLLFQNNSLSHMSQECISSLQQPALKTLELNIIDNPFTCDCHMRPQYEWMLNSSSSAHFDDTDKYKLLCHFPQKWAGQSILHLNYSDFVCLTPDSGNRQMNFIPIIFGVIFALVAVVILLFVCSKRHQIRKLFRSRHGDTSMMTAGYTSMDA